MSYLSRSTHAARLCTTVAALAFTGALLSACQQAPVVPATPVYTGPTLPIAQSERGVQIFLPSSALFESGKSSLNVTESSAYLQRVAVLINTKTDKNVILEGHTDNLGNEALNQELSEARARSVRQALIAQGIDAKRLSTAGYSFNRPVASNANDEGRKLNRRVEVVILEEKVENITRGEAPNAFENAWDRLKAMMDKGLIQPVMGK
ncbi:OmpA family protein [Rhodoferax sp. TBRC 17660]|uniref:OmpA family protein n=1 Tax=Rhodoferax potami TaxID=3068338 RepID=A0ABU3KLQ0_9BURK|nr:OmpA family protein [Rhodoferax sp. TBRC 17660]MDT7518189.1 OmpA family protein [Rhodoferax sp. TBRC 17660]